LREKCFDAVFLVGEKKGGHLARKTVVTYPERFSCGRSGGSKQRVNRLTQVHLEMTVKTEVMEGRRKKRMRRRREKWTRPQLLLGRGKSA